MNLLAKFRQYCWLVFLTASPLGAATLDLQFSPGAGVQVDDQYNDGSTRSVGTSSVPGLVATMVGRGYGLERAVSTRWGIQAGPLAGNPALSGWTIRNGFAPDKAGQTVSTEKKVEIEASYLSLTFSGVAAGTLFQGVSLTFSGVSNLKLDKAWAGLSVDGFSTDTTVKANNGGGGPKISLTFGDFTYSGGDPLEIRIYGIMGDDTGSFNQLTVTGEAIALTPVPEPDARFLITAVGLGAAVSFRRRSRDMPRIR